MRAFLSLFILLYLIFFNISDASIAKASHVLGASISYRNLGQDTYEIFLNVDRDCSQSQVDTTAVICVSDSCGNSNSLVLNKITMAFYNGVDSLFPNMQTGAISSNLICSSMQWDSRCIQSTGLTDDIQRYVYSAITVLNPSCNFWTFSHELQCCRPANRNISSSNSVIVSELSSGARSFNNSPVFGNNAVHFVCAGQPGSFSLGALELDGDSLYYEFVDGYESYNCQTGVSITSKFNPPYSGANPLAGIVMDPLSGVVSFTPTITGKWFVVVKISEYDRQGVFLGSVIRDAVIIVNTCVSRSPGIFSLKEGVSGWDYFSGISGLQGERRFKACLGDSISLIFKFNARDKGDSISINSKVAKLFPGSTFSISSAGDTAVAVFNWRANEITQGTRYFEVNAFNDACPYRNFYSFNFGIVVDTAIFDSHFDLSDFVCRKKGETTHIRPKNYQFGGSWKSNYPIGSTPPFIDASNFPPGETTVIIEYDSLGRCGSSFLDSVIVFSNLSDYEIWAAGTSYGQNLSDNLHHFAHEANFAKDSFFVPRIFSNEYDTVLLNNLEGFQWYDQIIPNGSSFEVQYNADSIANRLGYGVYRMETNYQKNYSTGSCSFSDTAFVFICDDSLNLSITESYIPGPNAISLDTILTASPSGYTYRWNIEAFQTRIILMWDTTLNAINISEIKRQEAVPISSVGVFAYERNSLGGPVEDTSRSCFFDNAEWSRALNVSEVQRNDFVKVYPNPATDVVYIESNQQITQLRLTNILGENLGSQNLQSESHVLNVDHLPAGLYFIELQFEARRKVLRFEKL